MNTSGWTSFGATLGRVVLVVALSQGLAKLPDAGAQETKPAEPEKSSPERTRAIDLCEQHRPLEALALLETLAKADPNDWPVKQHLAVALLAKSATVPEAEAMPLRKRAREILVDLKTRKQIHGLGQILLDGLPANGNGPVFSDRADIQAAMKAGEAAFVQRDYAKAREHYKKALSLDPQSYEAALFIGDTYFASNSIPEARDWFQRAILIDPQQETAHRYLGDAVSKAGLNPAARTHYVDAVLAEPYTRGPWLALRNWGEENKVPVGHPDILPADLAEKKPDQPRVDDDGRSHLDRYTKVRDAWKNGLFQKAYPGEKAFRHSLREEADALRQVAQAIAADVKAGKIQKPNPAFLNLIQLDQKGLLEAFVLFAGADEGVAQDYKPYRAKHYEELRRYLLEYVVPIRPIAQP